jgi:hypothetical protein
MTVRPARYLVGATVPMDAQSHPVRWAQRRPSPVSGGGCGWGCRGWPPATCAAPHPHLPRRGEGAGSTTRGMGYPLQYRRRKRQPMMRPRRSAGRPRRRCAVRARRRCFSRAPSADSRPCIGGVLVDGAISQAHFVESFDTFGALAAGATVQPPLRTDAREGQLQRQALTFFDHL